MFQLELRSIKSASWVCSSRKQEFSALIIQGDQKCPKTVEPFSRLIYILRFLAGATNVLLMERGSISEEGPPELILNKIDFETFAKGDPDSRESSKSPEPDQEIPDDEPEEEESRERGTVKFDIYKNYWVAVGHFLAPAILISLTLMQVQNV